MPHACVLTSHNELGGWPKLLYACTTCLSDHMIHNIGAVCMYACTVPRDQDYMNN